MTPHTIQFAFAILALAVAALPAKADVIRQQVPCPSINCVTLVSNGTVTARSFTFNAPRRGTAIVSFQGTLYCLNNNPSTVVLGIESQIVQNDAEPSAAGPSGLDYQQALPPFNGASSTDSFNLSSTRVFGINGPGPRTYQFNLASLSIPANAGCSVRYGAFRVHFVDRE
jgi:hypothetical protein